MMDTNMSTDANLDYLDTDKKPIVDFKDQVGGWIEELRHDFQVDKDEALKSAFQRESQLRQNNDSESSVQLISFILTMLHQNFEIMDQSKYSISLAKRRGQLKKTYLKIVNILVEWMESTEDLSKRQVYARAALQLCEGKLYVERQHVKATLVLAAIIKDEGRTDEACEILDNLQIDIFASISTAEKADYHLKHIKYLLEKEDLFMLQIVSRRFPLKVLEETHDPQNNDRLQQYYLTVLPAYFPERDYFSAYSAYKKLWKLQQEINPELSNNYVEAAIICLILNGDFGLIKNDMPNLINMDSNDSLVNSPVLLLGKEFQGSDLIADSANRVQQLKLHPLFQSTFNKGGILADEITQRIIDHNLYTMSMFYTKIHLSRMAELCKTSEESLEEELCELIVKDKIDARINRPERYASFNLSSQKKSPIEKWMQNFNRVLPKIERSYQLVKQHVLQNPSLSQKIDF